MSDLQIIGVNISNSRDFSAITSLCGNCNTVIDIKLYNSTINQIDLPLYIKCPVCGTKIKKHMIAE